MASRSIPKLIDEALKLKEVLESIGKPLPGGVSVGNLENLITELQTISAKVDSVKAQLTKLVNEKGSASKNLGAFITKAKLAIKVEFGPDSSEYEMAGGIRASERKKPVRKPKTTKQ